MEEGDGYQTSHPAAGSSACARLFKSFPGTQGLPEIFLAEGTDGSGSELAWGGKRRFAFPLNRLFSFPGFEGKEDEVRENRMSHK